MMQVVDQKAPREQWRSGVQTMMRASAINGSAQLCIFEQWCDPGHGAPTHVHASEEVLHVLKGSADVWIDDSHLTLTDGQSTIVPAGRRHGFSNSGGGVLHIMSTLASPVFEAAYDDKRETPRRWLPG
jgi:mannose-6-phosphate isomerase-like protein (cupin superfamily)